MFNLTDEQINEIVEYYGCSKPTIKRIGYVLNSLEIVDDEDDFIELIKSIVAQKESIKEQLTHANSIYEKKKIYMSLSDIIKTEVIKKYQDQDHKQLQLKRIYTEE